MDRFGRSYSDSRFSDPLTLDLDGCISGGVEVGAEFCELATHYGRQPGTTAPDRLVFALMVGGQVGGIAGVYLSVPAVAVLRIVWLECFSTQNSPVALSDQPLVRVRA